MRFLIPTSYKLQATSSKAFTLIELLVSAAIFTAILVLVIGSFTQSVSFGNDSTQQRVAREAARSWSDWLTRQLRAVGSTVITVPNGKYCTIYDGDTTPSCVAPSTAIDYISNGFVMVGPYDGANDRYQVADPGSIKGVTGIIFPTIDSTGTIRKYNYVGTCSGSNPVIRTSQTLIANTGSSDPCGSNWNDVGQILPTEAIMTNLKFYGIAAHALTVAVDDSTANCTTPPGAVHVKPCGYFPGQIVTYNYPAQPYLTWTMQIAPLNDSTNISAYETTITSRDYNFAYPKCYGNSLGCI